MSVKNTLEQGNKNERFEQSLGNTFGNVVGSGIFASGSSFGSLYKIGIFLRTGGANQPITFLGLKTATGYCDSFS